MDIEGWLRGPGLERYADAFRANDVGLDVLAELTDADLRELGVSLGDRRRLLKAARPLHGQDPDRVPPPGLAPASADEPVPTAAAAPERRQLTVMFVDLVGPRRWAPGSTPRRCATSSWPTRTRSSGRWALRGAGRQADGRRRALLLRLAPRLRGRGRARRPRRPRRRARLPRPEELTVSLAARVVGGEGHTSIAQTRSSDLERVALSKGSAPRASGAKRIGHRKGRLGPSAPIPCIRYVSRPNLSTEQRGLAEPKGGPP